LPHPATGLEDGNKRSVPPWENFNWEMALSLVIEIPTDDKCATIGALRHQVMGLSQPTVYPRASPVCLGISSPLPRSERSFALPAIESLGQVGNWKLLP